MMIFLRLSFLSFIGFSLLILSSIGIGIAFPVPLVEWSSSPVYLHDTRTGVNYPLQLATYEGARTIISGVQLVPSPENTYTMTITTNPTGLDLQIADAEGVSLHQIQTEPQANINNALWIGDDDLLLMRVLFPSGDLQVMRFEVATGTETEIATVDNNLFIVSPYNQWILLNDSGSDSTRIINTRDGRAHDAYPVYRSYAWSDDERYFASSAQLQDDEIGFQLLDTHTGDLITEQLPPTRLLWSSNNRDLIVTTEDEILIYRDMQNITQWQFQDRIVHLMWSPDGALAWIFTEANDGYDLYLLDVVHPQQVQLMATLSPSADLRTVVWASDSPIVTYSNDYQRNDTDVYRVHMLTGAVDRLTRIPDRIGQVRYLETFNRERYIP